MQSFSLTLTNSFRTESTLANLSKKEICRNYQAIHRNPRRAREPGWCYTDRNNVVGENVRTAAAAHGSPQCPAKIPRASASKFAWSSNSWSWGSCLLLLTSASKSRVAFDWRNLVSAPNARRSLENIRARPSACRTHNVGNSKLSKYCPKGSWHWKQQIPSTVITVITVAHV